MLHQIRSNVLVSEAWNTFSEHYEIFRMLPAWKRYLIGSGIAYIGYSLYLLVRRTLFNYRRRRNHLVPAIIGMPYFGSFFAFGYYGPKFNTTVLPKHGAIISHFLTSNEFITINDVYLAQMVLKHGACHERPEALNKLVKDDGKNEEQKYGAPLQFANEYENWRLRRAFSLKLILKIANKSFIDSQISNLLNDSLYQRLDNYSNINSGYGKNSNDHDEQQDGYMRRLCRNIAFNITFGALYGTDAQLDVNNKDFIQFNANADDVFRGASVLYISGILGFPVSYLLVNDKLYDEISAASLNCIQFLELSYDTCVKKYENVDISYSINKNNDNIPLSVLAKHDIENNDKYRNIINKDTMINDFWGKVSAATDTTALALEVAMIYAAKRLDLQRIIYDEIAQYSNTNSNNRKKFISIVDILSKCHKLRAFVHEVLRVSCPSPRGLPRAMIDNCIISYNIDKRNGFCKDIEIERIKGINSFDEYNNIIGSNNNKHNKKEFYYFIPKYQSIEANLSYIMTSDKRLWDKSDNTNEINLDYWLKYNKNDKSQYKFEMNKYSMPFGFGERICPGEALALRELYSFLANIFLNYKISLVNQNDNEKILEYEESITKTLITKIEIKMEQRK